MSNEQRAHDITMLYVELFSRNPQIDENGEYEIDPYSKYCEIYPQVLEKINRDFT